MAHRYIGSEREAVNRQNAPRFGSLTRNDVIIYSCLVRL